LRESEATFDLVSNLALAGAAAIMLVRPHHVSRLMNSPVLPKALALSQAATRAWPPATAPRPSAANGARHPIGRYSPVRRTENQKLVRTAGRRLNGGAAMLALSVLVDSAVEHYRGSFENRAMYIPLGIAALTLGASLFGMADWRGKRHPVRDTVYAAAAATGFAGLGFHTYNIAKRPGRWSWQNLFYAAPIGAPMALALAGLLGRGAELVRDSGPNPRARILGRPAGRMLAGATAAGLVGTVGEAGLLHFRGAYQNPVMFAPIIVPPIAAALLGASALRSNRRSHRLTRWWLRLTALLGLAGVGFHAYGVSRSMGGWRNWSQNVLNGPPLPAPPSFTGLALAGLAALPLIEDETDV
jgi:hypothetical protein